MRNFYYTILLSTFLFNVSIFAQTSCGTVTNFVLSPPNPVIGNSSLTNYEVTIFFTNSSATSKGIEYWINCGNETALGPFCYQTQGGTSTSETHNFTCSSSAEITVPWIGYTSSSGGCSGGVCGEVANAVLPVEFKSISGLDKEKFNIIQWETASESNSHYFMVEKSNDGK